MHILERNLLASIQTKDALKVTLAINAILELETKTAGINVVDEKGDTALHYAVRMDLPEIANMLITKGKIHVDAKNNQNTSALDLAIENKNLPVVKLLLSHDASIHDLEKLDLFLQLQDKKNPDVVFCQDKMHVIFSYIWIGGPSSKKESANDSGTGLQNTVVVGQDTQAAILMANSTNPKFQRILYWCLDQYAPYYHSLLSQQGIEVFSIEKFLNQCVQDPSMRNAAGKVQIVMEELLAPERNTRRDKTTIKNMVSLFLLKVDATDYTADSNVRPDEEAALNLCKYKSFHAPLFVWENGQKIIDVWMLYSPHSDAHASRAFNYFYEQWKRAESIYDSEGYSEKYRSAMGTLIVTSVLAGAKGQELTVWPAEFLLEDRSLVGVKEVGIKKYYDNTHKYLTRSEYEEENALLRQEFNESLRKAEMDIQKNGLFKTQIRNIIYDYVADDDQKSIIRKMPNFPKPGTEQNAMFLAAAVGDVTKLREFIILGDDINQVITKKGHEGKTPLHIAIENKQIKTFEVLLENGARVDIVLKDKKGKDCSVCDYIRLKIPSAERQPFLDLYEKHHPTKTLKLKKG